MLWCRAQTANGDSELEDINSKIAINDLIVFRDWITGAFATNTFIVKKRYDASLSRSGTVLRRIVLNEMVW